MIKVLEQYLTKNTSLSNDEIAQVCNKIAIKKLRKGEYLLEKGEISNHNSFVAKGCLRLYNISENGTEHILRFATENWWISDYESYNLGTPSRHYIDALENSVVLMLKKQDFDKLLNTIPNFKKFIDKLDARSFSAGQKRILSTISETAEKRYEKFITTYPGFFNRVPLWMIASYLGLTRETLSRIRSRWANAEK